MRKKTLHNATLIVTVKSDKKTRKITTVSVYDNVKQEFWPDTKIKERGILAFCDVNDVKETLNWNCNTDSQKYQFTWTENLPDIVIGKAYLFD